MAPRTSTALSHRGLVFALVVLSTSSNAINLSDWQGSLGGLIDSLTLLDLSLPGTHDSLTYDLSDTISDDTNDIDPDIASVLHDFGNLAGIADFIRYQSVTQGLSLVEQLDSGIRFFDFRITWSGPPKSASAVSSTNATTATDYDWYGLHLMQTRQPALDYLQDVRAWLDQHPEEIVVFWVSRHGNQCDTSFPGAAVADQQAWWNKLETLFGAMMFDTATDQLNVTTIGELKKRGHRALFFLSAPSSSDFSNSSTKCWDGCLHVDNHLGDGISNSTEALTMFKGTRQKRQTDKANSKFLLQSMAAGGPSFQTKYAAELKFQPFFHDTITKKCAEHFNIPGFDAWCPGHLQDVNQLTNYYGQHAFESATKGGLEEAWMPNAIYLNAVDLNGLMRTGEKIFGPLYGPSGSTGTQETSGYAYSWTLILFNIRLACQLQPNALCADLEASVSKLRDENPYKEWSDVTYGRLEGWPYGDLYK